MAQDAIIAELENALEKLEIAADQCTRGLLRRGRRGQVYN